MLVTGVASARGGASRARFRGRHGSRDDVGAWRLVASRLASTNASYLGGRSAVRRGPSTAGCSEACAPAEESEGRRQVREAGDFKKPI